MDKKYIENDEKYNKALNEIFKEISKSIDDQLDCSCSNTEIGDTIDDIVELSNNLNNTKILKEICVTDKLGKDLLVAEEYLILTKKTYQELKARNSYILKHTLVFESDEKFKSYFKIISNFDYSWNKFFKEK